MSMNVGSGDEGEAIADINVTPLVDVMLVLLIIFLITVPVVKLEKQVELPKITNIETKPKPEFIILTITENGDVFEGSKQYLNATLLKDYIKTRAVEKPQPEVHIKADRNVLYASVGRTIVAVQQGGIVKVAFITSPPPR
jgi:biopolymer transport protein ExbD